MIVSRVGAGPSPIPFKNLTSDALSGGIKAALQPEVLVRVKSLACIMSQESGSQNAANSFHGALDVDALRCSLSPGRAAVWRVKQTNIRLSALAAAILVEENALSSYDLQRWVNLSLFYHILMLKFFRFRPREYDLEDGPWDPISGGASALLGTLASLMIGAAGMPTGIIRALKVKSTKAQDTHESKESVAERSGNVLRKTPNSTSVPWPWALISSKVPPRQSFASSATKSPSRETLNNSISNRDGNFDLERKGKGQSRFRKVWFPWHQETSSQSSSKGAAPEDKNCFIEASESSRCLSPRPNIPNSQEDTETLSTSHKECQFASKFALENITGSRNSAARIVVSGLKFPMDFALHVAKGFHNAPRLYGDNSVRPLRKIDGFKTGLEASGRVILSIRT
jgi:hypothetical protein